MGGKSKSTNNQMVQFEMEQAAEAKAREAERKGRLEQGKRAITDIFQGGGFDDQFYGKYKNAALGYSLPQLQDQYQKQKDQLTYDLARAGTLRSRGAGTATADLEAQRIAQETALRSKADQDVGALRQGISGQEQTALNQLYATEDPTIAANTATGMVQQGQLSMPNLQPLGELFKPMIIGTLGAATNAINQYNFKNLTAGGGGGPKIVYTGEG